ncbi:MAG: hypothetical protein ABIH76_06115 [Candidatus Bathyarchaeota archaeon]
MERVGVLVVSYGSRGASIVDSLARSEKYAPEIYIADKQRNPFNVKKAKQHVVIPNLNAEKICEFVEKYRHEIDFGIVGSETPIIDGVRDIVEEKTNIPLICVTKKFALERSKIEQRLLLQAVMPEANPRYKIFDPVNHKSGEEVSKSVRVWIEELGGIDRVVIKPDRPGFGKGVGVGGEHFFTIEQAIDHFNSTYGGESKERVIIEEKVEGEESSFQAWCDGKTLAPLPETRDHKRAFDGDKGPNTGGTGSYKDRVDHLPFITRDDKDKEIEIVNKLFNLLRKESDDSGLRGMPFYAAFMHSKDGPKLLEINSRPGDPEIINLMPILRDDFVDTCYKMIEGNLGKVELEPQATVVTYALPLTYGSYRSQFSSNPPVNLSEVHKLAEKYGDKIRVYPGSMELREDGQTYALKSRAVCVVGIGDTIHEAREVSLDGIRHIDGPLWNRWDIGSEDAINKSIDHMKKLRNLV